MLAYASQFKLISAKDVGEISDQYNSLFTPEGFTFSIWGIIYIALIISCIYHIVIAYRHDKIHEANKDIEKMGALFLFNNIGAAAWLIAWTNGLIGLSLVLIVAQLISLIAIHSSLHIRKVDKSLKGIIYTEIPLSIYLGWISIATIANTAIFLLHTGWGGWGISSINWTIIMITIAVVLTIGIIISKKNPVFGLVVIWALYGIIAKQQGENPILLKTTIAIAWVGIGIISAATIIQFMQNTFARKKQHLHDKNNVFPLAHHSLK